MSKIEIKNPLQKPIFKSFVNQYIQIHYFKKGGDENREIENLKTLFFPPEHTDQLYSDLVSFVKIVIDKLVLNSLTLEKIKEDLSEEYEYDEETLNQINVIAMNNKNAIVDYINKNKGKVQKLLFLRWDRFSRDLTSATQYIQWFRQRNVEPNAVECIIDYDNETWSLMIGLQIGLAQSDNIKRSKATRDGIHGTLKQGKCSNKAPRGYKNVRTSKHDTHVEIDEAKAKPIRKAFQEIAKGVVCPCEVRRRYCPKIPVSSFLRMLRNVFYCGKILVPQYKDEPKQIVEGVHEPIIDEATFNQVQDILDGKVKYTRKIDKTLNPDLYLRKFLVCPVCGHALTGSKSKGRYAYYSYYHCNKDGKHVRVNADKVNKGFAEYVSGLIPNETVLNLYNEILEELREKSNKSQKDELRRLQDEATQLEKRLCDIEDKFIDGDIDKDTFNRMKTRTEKEIATIVVQHDCLFFTGHC